VYKFSVVIPAFNAEQYIGATLESVFLQTRPAYEIIVVNDGSTDGTLEVLHRFGDRIRIVDQKNSGVSAARNNGVSAATGDVIAFLDADDLWLPDKLLLQGSKLAEGYELAYTNKYYFGCVGDLPDKQSDISAMPQGDIWEYLLSNNVMTTSSVVVTKRLFQDYRGFDETMSFCEDWDLWLRLAEQAAVGYNPEPLVKYRVHFTGLSSNYLHMGQMREKVICAALASERGRTLSATKRRRTRAEAWACSAWEAARCKDCRESLRLFGKALSVWPFDGSIWYNIARLLTGRIV